MANLQQWAAIKQYKYQALLDLLYRLFLPSEHLPPAYTLAFSRSYHCTSFIKPNTCLLPWITSQLLPPPPHQHIALHYPTSNNSSQTLWRAFLVNRSSKPSSTKRDTAEALSLPSVLLPNCFICELCCSPLAHKST